MSEQALAIEAPVRSLAREPGTRLHRVTSSAIHEQPEKVVKSAGRVLRILEFFDARREAASVVDVARTLRMPQSSTSVLLRSLTLMGYLDYEGRSRTYRPTSRVAILGSWVNPALVQRGGVLDIMRDVSAKVGMTSVLAARNGLNAQYIHIVSMDDNSSGQCVGAMRPLATSAAGQLFLSLLHDSEVSKIIRRVNAYAGANDKIVRLPELQTRLADIRKRGFVYQPREGESGGATLGLLVPNSQGPLAFCLSGSQARIERECETLVALMRRHIIGLNQLSDGKVQLRGQ